MSIVQGLEHIGKNVVARAIAQKRVIIFILLIVFLSTISFAAGYLTARDTNPTPIIIQQ